MKKNINYLILFAFLFFINLYVVNAAVFEIKDGASTVDLSEYDSCQKPNSNVGTTSDYIARSKIDGKIFAFIKKVPNSSVSVRYLCFKTVDGKKQSEYVTVKANSTAKAYEGYNEAEESETTHNLISRLELSNFKSCKPNPTNAGAIDYIKIENNADGVVIRASKTIGHSDNVYLVCTTKDGRDLPVNVRLSVQTKVDGGDSSSGEDNSYNVSSNCDSILGSIDEDGSTSANGLPSVAYVLQKIFNFMKFLGPILAIAFTIMDLVKAVASSDKDNLNKTLKTTSKRLIFAVLLYVFPSVLNLILGLVSGHGTCKIQ